MQFNNAYFPADTGGCGFYRMIFPKLAMQTMAKNIRIVESMKLIAHPQFFRDIRVVKLQRQVSNHQAEYFLQFLKPLSKSIGFYIIYEVDDVIKYDDIPLYNIGREAFREQGFFNNIKNMLSACDYMTVTTETLKQYYIDVFDVHTDKIIVVPNYMPRWWVGEAYSEERQVRNFIDNIKRPRIGFPVSSSHFDLKCVNGNVDDFTHINDYIRDTVNRYQWVFIGGVPKQLEDLAVQRKIEVHHGSDLLNYPRELSRKNLQAVVAPLQDNVFNQCKSNIKLLESWSLGIPVVAQNLSCYNKYTDMVFDTADGLHNKLEAVLQNKHKYGRLIRENRNTVDYGDSNSPNGWWLEKNIGKHMEISTLPQKTLHFDITNKKESGVVLDI